MSRARCVAAAFVALAAAGCGPGAAGDTGPTRTTSAGEVPEGVLAEMRASTDCEALEHEAEVMRDRIGRDAAGAIERAVLEAATARVTELGCEP